MNDLKVGKTISYALRHNPEQYNLMPDADGFVKIDDLIRGLFDVENIDIEISDIERIMQNSDKKRYEIKSDKIRATYGHSDVHVKKAKAEPPEFLYHGTSHKAYEIIKDEGLKPMNRQFVHLSEETETAEIVGKRRDSQPVILKINAKKAFSEDVGFYKGNDTTWLSDDIPKEYIKVIEK